MEGQNKNPLVAFSVTFVKWHFKQDCTVWIDQKNILAGIFKAI